MSHFSVAVLSRSTKDVERLLAPYCEHDETLFEFEALDTSDEEAEYMESVDLQSKYPTLHGYLTEYHGYKYDQDHQAYGYRHNPSTKWDWYEIGGRWDNMLTLKPGKLGTSEGLYDRLLNPQDTWKCNQAKIGDLRFERDQEVYQQAIRFWEVAVEGDAMREGEDFIVYLKPEYYTEKYASKETYAESEATFSTYAFITADGEWYEEGEMGWFGISAATKESIASYKDAFAEHVLRGNPEMYLTIVDCHI